MPLAPLLSALRIQLLAALLIGGLAGWFAMLTQDGAISVAATGARLFLGLGIALPVGIVVSARIIAHVKERRILIASAVVGAVIGIIVYIAMIALINGSIGGEDLNAVRAELTNQIPIWQYGIVLAVNIIVGVIAPLEPDQPA